MILPGILLSLEMSAKYDVELVKRLRRRETDAMTTLYDRFGRLAYSVVLSIVRDGAVAEDLVQETFLSVWNRIPGFEPERGALGPWLLAIARNRAVDHVRAAAAPANRSSREPDIREHPSLFVDMERNALNADHSRLIRAALEKLNDQQRQVIGLAYYEGLPPTGMAERTGEPLSDVKSRVRTALKLLRAELGQEVTA